MGIHLGFIGNSDSFSSAVTEFSKEDLIFALSRPFLGIAIQKADSTLQQYADWLKLRVFSEDSIQTVDIGEPLKLEDLPLLTSRNAQTFGLGRKGVIQRGAPADLLLFRKSEQFTQNGILQVDDLKYIIFNGTIIFQNGRFSNLPHGKIIKRGN